MPLVKVNSSEHGHIIGLFHITESSDELYSQLELNPEEETFYLAYNHEEKKQEWCAARIVVSAICKVAGIPYLGMHKNGDGKPQLNESKSEISISHSFPYVAAIWHENEPVGIDLEQRKEKLTRIGPRFLNDEELATTDNDITKLCIFWCAKEALYKIYSKRGLIFKSDLEVIPEDEFPWSILTGKINKGESASFKLSVTIKNDFILVHNA